MKKLLICFMIFFACSGIKKGKVQNPHLFIEVKDFGHIEVELFPAEAPLNVANITKLANKGFYNGLTFHRVIKQFLIQAGCPKGDGSGHAGYQVDDEISLNLTLQKKVVAMANLGPNTNSSQFFVCMRACPELDGNYTIIGRVVKGWDVVEMINEVKTDSQDRPWQKVIIEKMRVDSPR